MALPALFMASLNQLQDLDMKGYHKDSKHVLCLFLSGYYEVGVSGHLYCAEI